MGSPAVGTATAIGLVDNSGVVPPHGATMPAPRPLQNTCPTSPASAIFSAYTPARPTWLAPRTPTTAVPCSPALAMASSVAARPATWPNTPVASSTAVVVPSLTVRGDACGSMPP